jgi:hypothetical protein
MLCQPRRPAAAGRGSRVTPLFCTMETKVALTMSSRSSCSHAARMFLRPGGGAWCWQGAGRAQPAPSAAIAVVSPGAVGRGRGRRPAPPDEPFSVRLPADLPCPPKNCLTAGQWRRPYRPVPGAQLPPLFPRPEPGVSARPVRRCRTRTGIRSAVPRPPVDIPCSCLPPIRGPAAGRSLAARRAGAAYPAGPETIVQSGRPRNVYARFRYGRSSLGSACIPCHSGDGGM